MAEQTYDSRSDKPYTFGGELVTSENYKKLTKEQRQDAKKALRHYLRGDLHYGPFITVNIGTTDTPVYIKRRTYLVPIKTIEV